MICRLAMLLLAAVFATGCASHLSVRTEVYDGFGLITNTTFGARSAERARATRDAIDALDTTIVGPVTEEFIRTIGVIDDTVPGAVTGGPDAFRTSYLSGVHDRVLLPLQPEIDRIRRKANEVESQARAGAGNDELRARLVELQTELQQLVDGVQTRLDRVTQTERKTFERAVRLNAASLSSDRLTAATGLPATTPEAKVAAIDFLARRADVAILDVGDAIGRALLAPIKAAKQATTEALMLPLGDPNVARIIGLETAAHWKKFVNDVHSTHWFGNSEAAFRMEGLGENHIKSVLFDPSEVTKVGLNVFSNTLRITAAAYGFSLPQEEKKDAQGNVTETIPATQSKAGIDAEVARIQGDRSVRGLKMEQLFWKSADAASKVTGTATDAAPADVVTALADLIDCMADEIAKPQTKKCGGTQ